MVFEVVFFFISLSALGLWLFASDGWVLLRRARRARRVRTILQTMEGKELAGAEAMLGPATEIVNGSGGRRLYLWKAPECRAIPHADLLLIITLTVNADGIVTHATWDER